VPIVRRADGVRCFAQRPCVGRAQREEIHDIHTAESPGARESYAAPDRRIVVHRIGGRRIQHHERDDRP